MKESRVQIWQDHQWNLALSLWDLANILTGKAVSDSPFSLRQSRRKMLRAFLQFSPSLHGLHSAVLKVTVVCFPGLAAEFAESPHAPHRGVHIVL